MVMSSRDRKLSVSINDHCNDHRQDTAACVSLSKSTISKTRTTFVEPTDTLGGGEERGVYPPPDLLSIAKCTILKTPGLERKSRPGAAEV